MSARRIAILGAGQVGRALGDTLRRAGHVVALGGRDENAAADVMPVAQAARDADVLMVTVPAAAAVAAVRAASPGTRIVLDCTNPLRWQEGPVWSPPAEGSVAAQLAASFPDAKVVKGFNHFGVEVHTDPHFAAAPADAFFAGDSAVAKRIVMDLAASAGFRAIDAGPLRNAAVLENLAVLWIHLAMREGRDFAFGMLRRVR